MRDAVLGRRDTRASVPAVHSQAQSSSAAPPYQRQPQYPPQAPPYSAGPGLAPGVGPAFGLGGSFLGTAASTAAGVIGGGLLLNSIRSMFGDHAGLGGQQRSAFGTSDLAHAGTDSIGPYRCGSAGSGPGSGPGPGRSGPRGPGSRPRSGPGGADFARLKTESWTAASKNLREQRPKHLDLAYGSGERTKWDLYPAADPKAPCFVHIHGGYWQRGSKEIFACLAEGALANGWSAALPGYTLAPEASLTQITSELRSALDWLNARGAEHGIAGPVMVTGWSAGGHLTAFSFGSSKSGSWVVDLGSL